MSFADQLELFYGATDPGAARIYAQLPADELTRGLQLGGSIYGPNCPYARTLPARFTFADAGPGPTLLAQATIQDPCFWSAEMPYLYTAAVELRRGGQIVDQVERPLGIRLLVVQGDRLEWEGPPYALRGVYRQELSLSELPELHASGTAVLVPKPSDEVCREASRCGVLLLALISEVAEQAIAELRRLSRWPAVGVAVIAAESTETKELRAAGRNLLLAQLIAAGTPQVVALWADVMIVPDVAALDALPRMMAEKPIIAWHGDQLQIIRKASVD
jgi:hypothetical protein